MSRLPKPGKDSTDWGEILNDFLLQSHNEDGSLKNTGLMATRAVDTSVVHTTGNETISGIKTFNDSPIVPNPQSLTAAANKQYVDSKITTTPSTAGMALTIAAYNAPDKIKSRADYVCDGTNDQEQFAAALDALQKLGYTELHPTAATGVFSGRIEISGGDFYFSNTLTIPNLLEQVTFQGMGHQSSRLQWVGPSTVPMFVITDSNNTGPWLKEPGALQKVQLFDLYMSCPQVTPSVMIVVDRWAELEIGRSRISAGYTNISTGCPVIVMKPSSEVRLFQTVLWGHDGHVGIDASQALYCEIYAKDSYINAWTPIDFAGGSLQLINCGVDTYHNSGTGPGTNVRVREASGPGSVVIDGGYFAMGYANGKGGIGIDVQSALGGRSAVISNVRFSARDHSVTYIKGPPTSLNRDFGLAIENCMFTSTNWTDADTPAILLPGGRDHIIRGNTFTMPGDSVILDAVTSSEVDNNIFANCGGQTTNTYAGVVLRNGTSKCRITQNLGKRSQGITGSKLQSGIKITDPTCATNRIWGNDFVIDDEASTNVTDNGTGTLTTI